jgi:hypothetical protein
MNAGSIPNERGVHFRKKRRILHKCKVLDEPFLRFICSDSHAITITMIRKNRYIFTSNHSERLVLPLGNAVVLIKYFF